MALIRRSWPGAFATGAELLVARIEAVLVSAKALAQVPRSRSGASAADLWRLQPLSVVISVEHERELRIGDGTLNPAEENVAGGRKWPMCETALDVHSAGRE